ncbi:hypothetical protein POM88_009111 [Heracleum sosnowskyi]|uniref:Protein kinase domain-containing protein n=1 Tax=Heracleum sosnowskyi TaxID=360622 RepID=A0AAD8J8H9_9APIA|nr:hypothetical protein POM88_009111 [Heracleum sosnowskyi]
MAHLVNLVVKDGPTRYKLLRPIGQWGPAFTLPLYEAAILSPQDNKTCISFVAFKMISNTQEDYFNMAFQDVKTSQVFQFNSNILPFARFFQANVKGATLLCIVLPYETIVTSLRSLLSSNPRFSGGMDEKMIALVLEKALRGLDAIHKAGKHHTRITADTVLFDLGEPTFYLAYASSLYERTTPNLYDWNCLPVNRMLAWGLAPEVKNDESLEFVDVYETEKSDIWLIGILGLELAYGRILVENRRELLDITNYISSDPGALMDTWEELRIKSAEFAPGGNPIELPIVLSVNQTRFSERFRGFLARCLNANPENRASAEELLNVHEFLRENVGKMKTFSDVVKGIDPHVARFLDRDRRKKKSVLSRRSYQTWFRHNGITYTILEPIGTWGPEYSLTVYEAVFTTGFNDPAPRHVAFKMAKNVEGEYFELAMDSVERNTLFKHINILPLNSHFCKRLKGLETLCMVLPFDSQVLSLRSIISTGPKFANGIPQRCIAVALLYAVRGLDVLHFKDHDHYEITAGNIFYNIKDKSIKLAYAASCYERTYAAEESGECSINNLLSWASPPEVDILEREGLIHEYDTFKADIWFIGIAALELAYGRIRVANRRELLRIARYISNVRRLPDTWEELRTETAEVENPQRFDEYFGKFVAMCLATEPTERPSARQLLQDDFLRYVHGGASMEIFNNMMVKGCRV